VDNCSNSRNVTICLAALFSAVLISNSGAATPLKEARITQLHNDVRLLGSDAVPRHASVNDNVGARTALQTGGGSRAELTFSDQTVARLAANTALDFKDGTQNLNLSEGALLFQVPKTAKGVKVHAAGVAAAITGSTVMFEHHPGMYKFLVLEGNGRLYRPGHLGDSVLVQAGQMVIGNPNSAVSDPIDVDIARFLKTSHFIIDFAPLRSEASIVSESQKQQRQKSKKMLIDTNLVIFGGGTQVSVVEPAQIDALDQGATAPATPTSTSKPNPRPDSIPPLRPSGSAAMNTAKTH
jgi:FecR protein